VTGTGSGDQTVTVTGNYADVNAARNGLTFNAPSSAGAVQLTVTTNDQGLAGVGPLTATDLFTINVQEGRD
jgi:hypothetical protein